LIGENNMDDKDRIIEFKSELIKLMEKYGVAIYTEYNYDGIECQFMGFKDRFPNPIDYNLVIDIEHDLPEIS
jgi:hypothetical protein